MADNIYGVKLVVLTELNQDGSAKTEGAKVIRIDTPQEVSYSPNIKEGGETELRVGDKLIRPFDKTLHEVLTVREESRAKTWVWNPRTEAKRYIVHGFADGISKTYE